MEYIITEKSREGFHYRITLDSFRYMVNVLRRHFPAIYKFVLRTGGLPSEKNQLQACDDKVSINCIFWFIQSPNALQTLD